MVPEAERKEAIDPSGLLVELSCSSQLDVSDPLENAIRRYHGRLITCDLDEDGEEVARFSYYDLDVVIEDGEVDNGYAVMVMDSLNQETRDAYDAIRDNLNSCSEGWVNRVVYIERLFVHPKYRGNKVARWLLGWLLDHISFGAADPCVAVTPYPLQDDDRRIEYKDLTEEQRAEIDRRKGRLVSFYESAGFKQLGESDVWALGLAFNHPDPRQG